MNTVQGQLRKDMSVFAMRFNDNDCEGRTWENKNFFIHRKTNKRKVDSKKNINYHASSRCHENTHTDSFTLPSNQGRKMLYIYVINKCLKY